MISLLQAKWVCKSWVAALRQPFAWHHLSLDYAAEQQFRRALDTPPVEPWTQRIPLMHIRHFELWVGGDHYTHGLFRCLTLTDSDTKMFLPNCESAVIHMPTQFFDRARKRQNIPPATLCFQFSDTLREVSVFNPYTGSEMMYAKHMLAYLPDFPHAQTVNYDCLCARLGVFFFEGFATTDSPFRIRTKCCQ